MSWDKHIAFSWEQALAATGNSTNYVDGQAALNIGQADPLRVMLHIAAKGGTSPTIAAVLVGADDSAFSSNKITIGTTGTLSDPALGLYEIPIRNHKPKRYYRIEYTLGGTSPTFTVTCGPMLGAPSPATGGIWNT